MHNKFKQKNIQQNPWLIFLSKSWIIIYIIELIICILCTIFAPQESKTSTFFEMLICFAVLTIAFTYYLKIQKISKSSQQTQIQIQCPYCKSYHTEKISTISRGASTVALGLASSKIGKQWHCNKCGSDF